jgi:YceG-like family
LSRDNRSQARERTEAEREQAREERERRRLAKAGSAKPVPPIEERPVPPLPPPLTGLPETDEQPSNGLVESDAPTLEPHRSDVPAETAPRDPSARSSTSDISRRASIASGRQRKGQSGSHHPHLLRPHIHRPHVPRWRGRVARAVALLALTVMLGGLAVGAVLLVHHSERPKVPPLPVIVKVVIPEGYTRTQIAELAHADGLRGSYLAASKRSAELDPRRYRAPAATSSLEGFLFPATYEMDPAAPAARLVSEQLAAFRRNFGGGEVHRAKLLGVTPYQLLIVASIVEREAGTAHDRPLVAAVIYNRLRQNMTLGVDATLRYALHDFTHPLTEAQLSSDSPYNTRTRKGLPPTPISNPGAAAIRAAARPAKVSYLYYVAGADGCGEQVFSTSYAQFEKNAAAYREALRKNGGRVPTCKKR